MSELDEAWAMALAEAEQRARSTGRGDIVDYLALRNSNDFLRQTGVNWLIDTFNVLAASANRNGASIQTSNDETHRFVVGNSTMVGRLLTLRFGVRTLFVEAGWPRVPRHGFVSGGGLARGNIRHLGMKSSDLKLVLVRLNNGDPVWMIERGNHRREQLHESLAKHQLRILLDEVSR
jgi:hypothetical protein